MPVCPGDGVKVIFSTCSVTFLILSSLNPLLLFPPSSLPFIFPLLSHPWWLHSLLLWLLYVLFLFTKPLSSSPLHSPSSVPVKTVIQILWSVSRPLFLVNLTVPLLFPCLFSWSLTMSPLSAQDPSLSSSLPLFFAFSFLRFLHLYCFISICSPPSSTPLFSQFFFVIPSSSVECGYFGLCLSLSVCWPPFLLLFKQLRGKMKHSISKMHLSV